MEDTSESFSIDYPLIECVDVQVPYDGTKEHSRESSTSKKLGAEGNIMQVKLQIPTRAQILSGGFIVKVARAGESWSKAQLGAYADLSGVYVHHSGGSILYVGKTTAGGTYGNFGERLRREFQESASGNSGLHQLLCKQPQDVRAYCLDLMDLDMMVDQGPMALTRERKALIMEQVLIGIFEPPGNLI